MANKITAKRNNAAKKVSHSHIRTNKTQKLNFQKSKQRKNEKLHKSVFSFFQIYENIIAQKAAFMSFTQKQQSLLLLRKIFNRSYNP